MKKVTFANIHSSKNVGDFNSCPLDYFDFPYETIHAHFVKKIQPSDALIIGGGGLMFFKKLWEKITKKAPICIAWGIGENVDENSTNNIAPDDASKGFLLWGTRDFNKGYQWVPCSSCMSDLFMRNYAIKHQYVCFEHLEKPLGLNMPTMSNDKDFRTVLEFIGSGSTVITTSYHGAYWATLLGRKVIVLKATSNKFSLMKHPPLILDKFDPGIERLAKKYPNSLQECRIANLNFYKKVREVIDAS